MAPPSKLAIATSAVQRLIKEEASYHKEIQQQQSRIQKLESSSGNENVEYELKQEKQALAETETVLVSMKGKIQTALDHLDEQIEENRDAGDALSADEVTKAKEITAEARKAVK